MEISIGNLYFTVKKVKNKMKFTKYILYYCCSVCGWEDFWNEVFYDHQGYIYLNTFILHFKMIVFNIF